MSPTFNLLDEFPCYIYQNIHYLKKSGTTWGLNGGTTNHRSKTFVCLLGGLLKVSDVNP
jgi:hypothetical protein